MVTALRRIQYGVETTRGTAVSASKRLLGRLSTTPRYELYRPDDEERNSLGMYHRLTNVGQHSELEWAGSLTFEQVIVFLSMGVKAEAISTPAGGTTSRDWLYEPTLTAANSQKAFTFQYGDDVQAYQYVFTMAEELEFTYAMNAVMTGRARMFARKYTQTTFTASPTLATVEDVVTNNTKLYVDTTWANLGTTEKNAVLVNATLRLPTGLTRTKYADGSLNFSSFGEAKRSMEVEMTLKHSAVGRDDFLEKFDDQSLNFIRLETSGSTIEGALTKLFRVDMAVRWHEAGALFEDMNGENIFVLRGQTYHDPTADRDLRILVRNTQTAL
jgi:hypothetical protein